MEYVETARGLLEEAQEELGRVTCARPLRRSVPCFPLYDVSKWG